MAGTVVDIDLMVWNKSLQFDGGMPIGVEMLYEKKCKKEEGKDQKIDKGFLKPTTPGP